MTVSTLCRDCEPSVNSIDGVCTRKKASDGLVFRCVGDWAKEKYDYLKRYIEIFETSMKNKWEERNFVDLFAGPGICMARESEEEILGSPMLGIQCYPPFTGYFFVDKNSVCVDSLRKRCKNSGLFENIRFFEDDCNIVAKEISRTISNKSLNLAFIDPTGLDIKFSTIEELTKDRRVDLIINFPIGTAVNRNWERLVSKEGSKLDEFMGDEEWRFYYQKAVSQGDASIVRAMLKYYRKQLKSIGYTDTQIRNERLIRSSTKNLPLYYLVFASKNPKGLEFWKKLGLIEPSGQRTFPFSLAF